MNIKNLVIKLLSISLFVSCNKNELSKAHSKVIKNSIEILLKENYIAPEDCYIIDPKHSMMNFSVFLDSNLENRKKLLNLRNLSELKQIQKKINSVSLNKINSNFNQYSKCNSSDLIISFSGFSDNFVMCYFIDNSEKVTNEQLLKEYKLQSNQENFFLLVYNKNGDITEYYKNALFR